MNKNGTQYSEAFKQHEIIHRIPVDILCFIQYVRRYPVDENVSNWVAGEARFSLKRTLQYAAFYKRSVVESAL